MKKNSASAVINQHPIIPTPRLCMSFEEAPVSVTDAEVAFRSIPQSEVRKTMRSTIEICIAIAARVEKS